MKNFLIFLAILLLAGTGYLTYNKWVKSADLDTWSLVPENSILVYESNSLLATFRDLEGTSIWKNLEHIDGFSRIPEKIRLLDTLTGKGNFEKYFQDTPTLISMNITSSREFDFLYIVEVQNLSQQTYISKALAYFRDQGYTTRTREYQDFTISDITSSKENTTFTYIFYKNYFIGSATAFLVEDAIRTISTATNLSFQEKFPELQPVIKLEKDHGNIYFNFSRLSDLINLFSDSRLETAFATSAFLDMRVSEDAINLNGFTFSDLPTQIFSIFQNSNGASRDMTEIIPNATAWMYHLTFSDGSVFSKSLVDHLEKTTPKVNAKRNELIKSVDFDVKSIFQLVDEEIGIVTLENSRKKELDKLLILEIKDMGEALNFFNSVGERIASTTGDSIYKEPYGDFEIRKLPVEDFPYALLGNMAVGFPQSFYISYRNYLVFANSIYQLKSLLQSIESENTWNKSLSINRFLEKTNKEANFSLFVNTPRAWNHIQEMLKPDWQAFANENQFTFRNFEYMAFQLSNVDRKFYTNVTLYQPDLPSGIIPEKIEVEKSILLSNEIITKPHIVTNHNSKSREVILQDSLHNVYLVSEDIEVLWSKTVDGPVVGGFSQIDYYKNDKLQYVFSTDNSIYIIDRTGAFLPGFPVSLPENQEIAFFTVIDYDNTKNYRFAVADTKGNLFLTNKNGKPLDGWDPKMLDGPLGAAPAHVRINGRDIIIAMQQNGKIHFWTRKGSYYKPFPLDVGTELIDGFYINGGSNLSNSVFSTMTQNGEILDLNFEGQVIRRNQLYKPSVNTQFRLVKDVSGDGYILIRNTEKRYEVLDETGNVLFEKDYFSNQPMMTQYYKLGGGIEWIIFVDPGGRYLYIYDRSGALISGRPLTASVPISVIQYETKYDLYLGTDAELSVLNLIK